MARRRRSRRRPPCPATHYTKPTCQPLEVCHELTAGIANKPACVASDHCRDESASCGDLQRRYLALLDAPPTEIDWRAIWHLFITHEWFQTRLERCARSVLRASFLSDQWADDVKQEVMVKLADKLRRIPDLKLDQAQAEMRFAGWLHTIILRDCRMAVRRLRRLHYRTLPLLEDRIGDDPVTKIDERLDFLDALRQLDDVESSAMLLYAKGCTMREIGATLGFSSSTACRLVRRAIGCIERRLEREESRERDSTSQTLPGRTSP